MYMWVYICVCVYIMVLYKENMKLEEDSGMTWRGKYPI